MVADLAGTNLDEARVDDLIWLSTLKDWQCIGVDCIVKKFEIYVNHQNKSPVY